MNSTLIALKERWQALAPRERLALRSLALILALAMLGQLLWTAHERSQRLRRQLPVLEQQLALMRQGQAQWQELENNPAPPLPSLAEPRVQQVILASAGELQAFRAQSPIRAIRSRFTPRSARCPAVAGAPPAPRARRARRGLTCRSGSRRPSGPCRRRACSAGRARGRY